MEDIDHAVHRLRLGAIADFVVVDLLRLRRAAAQVVEAGKVHALVDAGEHRHVGCDLVVRADGPRSQCVVVLGAFIRARGVAAHALVEGAVGTLTPLL